MATTMSNINVACDIGADLAMPFLSLQRLLQRTIFSLLAEAPLQYSGSTTPMLPQQPPATILGAQHGYIVEKPDVITRPKPNGSCRYATDFKPRELGKTGEQKVTMPLLQGVGGQRTRVTVGVSFNECSKVNCTPN